MFVLLEHDPNPADAPPGVASRMPTHWDFMIELQGAAGLATWRFTADPTRERNPVVAERIGDHRSGYLEYEGPLSGDRGVVKRIDRGPSVVESWDGHSGRFVLRGAKLVGRFEIVRRSPAGLVFQKAPGA